MDAVVTDLDGDLPVWQVRSYEWGLNFDMGFSPGVQNVPAEKLATGMKKVKSHYYPNLQFFVYTGSQSFYYISNV